MRGVIGVIHRKEKGIWGLLYLRSEYFDESDRGALVGKGIRYQHVFCSNVRDVSTS